MNVTLTRDSDFIVRCMLACWDMCSDDGDVNKDLFFPVFDSGLLYVKIEDYGFFMVHAHNYVTYEVHTILPFAGNHASEAAEAGKQWLFDNTPCLRIVTNVPSFNKIALRFAKKNGMVEYGVNEKSYLKNGILYDQTLLGVSKGA